MHVPDVERVHSHLANTLTALADAMEGRRYHPEDLANLASAARHLKHAHASILAISNRQRRAQGLKPMKRPLPEGFPTGSNTLEH
jgi:hypothetical protein